MNASSPNFPLIPARLLMLAFALVFSAGACVSATEGSPAKIEITLAGPAYAGMPVWANVSISAGSPELPHIRYPFDSSPTSLPFGFSLEVKHDGKALPVKSMGFSTYSGVRTTAPVGASSARLPLQVFCDLSDPGSYEVRLVVSINDRSHSAKTLAASQWTKFVLLPSTAQQRDKYFEELIAKPPTDPGLIVSDFLPSLLATRDSRSLAVLMPYIGNANSLVSRFALVGLGYFPEALVRTALIDFIKITGPTVDVAYYLSHHKNTFTPQAVELVDAILPHLKSDSPDKAGASIHALVYVACYDLSAHPELPARIQDAIWAAAPHIRSLQSRTALWPLVLFAGSVKSDRSRELLWELIADESVREQAFICLTWIKDPQDLPKLGDMLKTGAYSLAMALHQAYGKDAIPYLLTALKESTDQRDQAWSAKELLTEDRVEAYRFFKDVLENGGSYKQECIQILRDYPAKDQKADEGKLLSMVRAKIAVLE